MFLLNNNVIVISVIVALILLFQFFAKRKEKDTVDSEKLISAYIEGKRKGSIK